MKHSSYRRLVSWRLLNQKEEVKRSLKGAEEFLRDLCLSPEVNVDLWWIISQHQEVPFVEFWVAVHAQSVQEAERIGSLFESDCASHTLSTPIELNAVESLDLSPLSIPSSDWTEERVAWGPSKRDKPTAFFGVAERLARHRSNLALNVKLSAAQTTDLRAHVAHEELKSALWSYHGAREDTAELERVMNQSQHGLSQLNATLRVFTPRGASSHELGLLSRGLGYQLSPQEAQMSVNAMLFTPERASIYLPLPRLHQDSPLAMINTLPDLPPPRGDYARGLLFGTYQSHERRDELRVPLDSRHHYVVGQTGTGKSTHLLSMIMSAVEDRERAVFVMDPHGELAESVLDQISPQDQDRVLYIDLGDTEHFIGLNLLEAQDVSEREFLIGELDHMFLTLYGPEIWGPRLQDVFRNTANALSLDPDEPKTLIDLIWAFDLSDHNYREQLERIAGSPEAPITLQLYLDQIQRQSMNQGSLNEVVSYFRAKFSPFIDNIYTRNILGQSRSTLDFNQLISDRRICIFNLAKGRISARYSTLIGKLLALKIFQSVIRTPMTPHRPEAMVVLDEFQNFIGGAFSTILSEGRKYGINLVLAHQHLSQLTHSGFEVGEKTSLLDSVLGNVGSIAAFRMSDKDARLLAPHFGWDLTPQHLSALPNWSAIAHLTLGQHLEPPILFETLPLTPKGDLDQAYEIKRRSVLEACRSRETCEGELRRRIMIARGEVPMPKDVKQSFINRAF